MDNFNPNILGYFILKVKEKSIYEKVDEEVLKGFLYDVLKKNQKCVLSLSKKYDNLLKKEQIICSKEFKSILKEFKKILHENYGVFFVKNQNSISNFLKEYKANEDFKHLTQILKLHTSTNERLEFYDDIEDKLSAFYNLSEIDFVVDVACGYNPIRFCDFFKNEDFFYFFTDLNIVDIDNVLSILNLKKINCFGINCNLVFQKDYFLKILNEKFEERKPKNALCVLFKALDSFENLERNFSLNLLKSLINIGFKKFLVSFPTKTIGGRNNILEQKRSWFLNFLNKNTQFNFVVKSFEIDNEVFYFICLN